MQIDRLIRQLYAWACERLYHECAWSYDIVSRVVSAGAWPAWRRLVLEEIRGGAFSKLDLARANCWWRWLAAAGRSTAWSYRPPCNALLRGDWQGGGWISARAGAGAGHAVCRCRLSPRSSLPFPHPISCRGHAGRVLARAGCQMGGWLWADYGLHLIAGCCVAGCRYSMQMRCLNNWRRSNNGLTEAGFAVQWRVRQKAGCWCRS